MAKKTDTDLWKEGRKILLENSVSADPAARENAMGLISLFASLEKAVELGNTLRPGQKNFFRKGLVIGGKWSLLLCIAKTGRLPPRNENTAVSKDFWETALRIRTATTKRLDFLTAIMRKRAYPAKRPRRFLRNK